MKKKKTTMKMMMMMMMMMMINQFSFQRYNLRMKYPFTKPSRNNTTPQTHPHKKP